jgi:hypothetical protein
MLTILRKIVVSQSTNTLRVKSFVRLVNSLQQQHKEHSLKSKDILIDPNLKQAFEKIKKGDFIPPILDVDSEMPPKPMSNARSTREQIREGTLGKLVYTGKLDRPFRAAKSLSLTSSLGGALLYPFMLPKILQESSVYIAIGYTIISATFVLLTPSLIQLICKRYLTSLYYHEQTGQFTGFYKNFFMMERQIRFRAEDVEVPPITGIFTSMLIKNQPYFINHEDFHDKPILMKMLGYDKEFDFSKYTKDIQRDDD